MTFQVSSHVGAAIWATSGPAIDGSGNIFVASGNAFSGGTFDYSNSVIKLSPTLSLSDWFAPKNWAQLDKGDIDLGSMGPLLLQDGLIFQAGKEGVGYLIEASDMGKIGGEAFSTPLGQGAYGGAAYDAPYIFVPTRAGLVALKVDSTPSFKVVWSSAQFNAGSPVVAGSTVITLDLGSGTLFGFNVDNGEQVFKVLVGGVMHFTTPALSGGRVVVAAGGRAICLGD